MVFHAPPDFPVPMASRWHDILQVILLIPMMKLQRQLLKETRWMCCRIFNAGFHQQWVK